MTAVGVRTMQEAVAASTAAAASQLQWAEEAGDAPLN
jgi:hypothetical protein